LLLEKLIQPTMNAEHDTDFSIRGFAASGILEGAVSKPALATRNVHENLECEMQANDYNTINDHNNNANANFKRSAPSTVLLEVRVAWCGESISMDELMEHMEQFGVCDPSDWQSSSDYNEAVVCFHCEGDCKKAKEMTNHKIVDSKGKLIRLKVN
jgi:hypothetical protein